jgi:SAM-dependent methyltransferase
VIPPPLSVRIGQRTERLLSCTGADHMRAFYTLAYWIGFKPWETAATREAERLSALFDREEKERMPPYGRVLDIGCGTGIHAVALARRGWQVTGVEIVPKALRAARRRVEQAGVDVRLIQCDVTALRADGVGADFSLVLDFGCFHGLNDTQRAAMAREVTAVTVHGATILMIAWAPGRRRLLPRGAGRKDIEDAFQGWEVIGEETLPVSALPGPLRNAAPAPRCYRLRRD